jgi:hypothetical protein
MWLVTMSSGCQIHFSGSPKEEVHKVPPAPASARPDSRPGLAWPSPVRPGTARFPARPSPARSIPARLHPRAGAHGKAHAHRAQGGADGIVIGSTKMARGAAAAAPPRGPTGTQPEAAPPPAAGGESEGRTCGRLHFGIGRKDRTPAQARGEGRGTRRATSSERYRSIFLFEKSIDFAFREVNRFDFARVAGGRPAALCGAVPPGRPPHQTLQGAPRARARTPAHAHAHAHARRARALARPRPRPRPRPRTVCVSARAHARAGAAWQVHLPGRRRRPVA